jgi:GT2 family glycosyltransferase
MNSTGQPSVSIVIPSWNGRMLLEQMLPSLLLATKEFRDQTGGQWEVIVVDDGSVDDTIPWIETIPERNIKLITRRRKSGFALACNLGFSACRYETVILLNNDLIVDKGFILPLLPHFRDERVFGVAFKSLLRDQAFDSGGKIGEFSMGFWRPSPNYDVTVMDSCQTSWQDKPYYSFSVYRGFCALSRRKLQELGGFEPMMSPFYWEDVELSYRAWKRGWVIHYEPQSMVYLDNANGSHQTYPGVRLERINIRNRFIFMWKNLHDPGMFLLHLGGTLILVVQAVFTVRAAFFLGLWDTLRALPAIFSKRRLERRAARVKDSAIRKIFSELKKENFVETKQGSQKAPRLHSR